MTDESFADLIEATSLFNKELYRLCHEEEWHVCADIISRRATLLAQLSDLTPSLTQAEIDILGALYQNILENDKIHLDQAETERVQVKKQLRHLKRAELKALPAYRKNRH